MSDFVDNAFDSGTDTWLTGTGHDGVYHSAASGAVAMRVTIETATDIYDDRGMSITTDIAIIKSGLVVPVVGEAIDDGTGRSWKVASVISDHGNAMQLAVQLVAGAGEIPPEPPVSSNLVDEDGNNLVDGSGNNLVTAG